MKNLLLVTVLLSTWAIFGQDSTVVRDFESWSGISVKKSFLENKLDLQFTQELRLKDNSTKVNNYFSELEVGYDITKRLSIDGGFRFIRDNRNSGYKNFGRLYTDLNFNHKVDRFKFNYRLRFQHQQQFGISKEDGDFPEVKYRLKAKIEYNIKKWKLDPYLSGEVFFTHQTYRITYVPGIEEPTQSVNAFEKFRVSLGTSYAFNKSIELGAFYRVEREFKSFPLFYNTPATYFIGGLQLNFKL